MKLAGSLVACTLLFVSAPAALAERLEVPFCTGAVGAVQVASVDEVYPKMAKSSAASQAGLEPLEFVGADWEVDVKGTLASGVLFQDFLNSAEHAVEAFYIVHPVHGLEIEGVELEVDGEATDAELKAVTLRKNQRSRPGRRAAAPRGDAPRRTDAVQVPAGGRLTAILRFQQGLSFEEGAFTLDVPPLSERCLSDPRSLAFGRGRGSDRELDVPISWDVAIERKTPIAEVTSFTHEIETVIDETGADVRTVQDGGANDGFQVSFTTGYEHHAVGELHVGPEREGAREVMLQVTPPTSPEQHAIRAKEALFIIDTSGSMKGSKIDAAREALIACLEALGPDDLFNVIHFHSNIAAWQEQPAHSGPGTVAEVTRWLEDLEARGGTRLEPALQQTLGNESSGDIHRLVTVITDGALGDEERVVALLQEALGNARLLVVGIGPHPKLDTLQRIADLGRGEAVLAREVGQVQVLMARLFGSFSEPVAWDLRLDWDGAEVESVRPARLPDLHAGRPVTVHARILGQLPLEVRVTGTTTDGPLGLDTRVSFDDAIRHDNLQRPRRHR